MPKSKHRKNHQSKLNDYKDTKKKEQELFKKKMLDNYIKMQQEKLASQESHTSTEEVSGPEINLDDLNMTENLSSQEINNVIDVEPIIDDQWKELNNIIDFNQPLDKPIEL